MCPVRSHSSELQVCWSPDEYYLPSQSVPRCAFFSWNNSGLFFLFFLWAFRNGDCGTVSCFRNDPDVPTTSDYDGGFKYIAQSESSSAVAAKEEEVGSSNGEQEWNFKDMGWFLQVQKASMSSLLHPNLRVFFLEFTWCRCRKYL